jgi:carbonic anhydrase/acetyltransferase-like protein (isoleucine patch superfamily)
LYDCALVTIGQISGPAVRSRVFLHLRDLNYEMPAIVSPRAYVSKHATVGEGTIVLHDALVNARASIGQNCIINTKALIEHDSNIGDNCHVSTGAIVNGGVTLGSGSFLGSNAGTKQLAVVNENEFVRAGTFFVGHANA